MTGHAKRLLWILAVLAAGAARPAAGGDAVEAIRLAWAEGDVAGMITIFSPDGKSTIGFVEFRQRRRGDVLTAVRVARFKDGSSDEDRATVRVGRTLQTLRGRSIIRNTKGVATLDVTIDVASGHIKGFSGLGDKRELYDEKVELAPGTYLGASTFLMLKNFDKNASGDRLVFQTVICTPKPRVIDMELVRVDQRRVDLGGRKIDAVHFTLRPTVNWLVDPLIRAFVPDTSFFVQAGAPPALVRFEGPRNFAGQLIRIQ